MDKIRVGIIGTGFGASVHAPVFQLHEGYEVKAIATVQRGRVSDVQAATGIQRVCVDWKRMLEEEELDLVAIASAPVKHYEMTMEALSRGLHVLCEKPLGFDAEQTKRMLEQQKNSMSQAFVNFQWRLTPVRQKIKEILQDESLGRIQHITYNGSFSGYSMLSNNQRGWEGRSSEGGGMLFAIGSHMIDSMMWWMNERICDVYAQVTTHVPQFNSENGEISEHRDAEDAFTLIGHFEKGASFVANLLVPAVRGNGWSLEMYGTKGTLRMKNDTLVEVSYGGEFEQVEMAASCEPPASLAASAGPYYSGFYPMIDGIYQAIVSNKVTPHLPTFVDGHYAQLVMDAVRKSAAHHSKIVIQYS